MTIDEIAGRLYGLPPEEFTGARNDAAKALRAEGRREEAAAVAALRKPTAAASAANRLVRERRGEVEAFLHAAALVRDAQLAGTADHAAAAHQRELLDRLVEARGAALRAILQAAAVDDGVARDLLAGRLEREPPPPGFGTLLSHAARTSGRGRARAVKGQTRGPVPSPARIDDGASRARLREARERLTAATAEEREARRRWARSQRELETASTALERARRELDELRRR